ncbi:MAG: cob(I)yrinic acid a,c-diamide adenosyltransferase [Bacteroidales bacterium]
MPKIYTKTGDTGTTSLVGGTRVFKNNPRVKAYGDVDELIAEIGLLRAGLAASPSGTIPAEAAANIGAELCHIENMLMYVAAHLAAEKPVMKLKDFSEDEVAFLENRIDVYTSELPEQRAFIIPSSPMAAAHCHVARAVCRRAERSAMDIPARGDQDALVTKYLNRLSDYLFVLARKLCALSGVEEEYWIQ